MHAGGEPDSLGAVGNRLRGIGGYLAADSNRVASVRWTGDDAYSLPETPMHRSANTAHRLFLISVSAFALTACEKKAAAPAQATPPPPEVAIVTVSPTTMPVEYEFVGLTEASKTVELRARVAGFLIEKSFDEGKPIYAGDPLFQIDPRPFEADLEIAKARLAQAEAQSKLAETDVARFSEAVTRGASSVRELDRVQTDLANAKASVNLAKAQVQKAELDLGYTRIESPVTGVIGRTLKDEGSFIDAGANSLLAVASQTNPMYVTFPISERDWLRWRDQADRGVIVGDRGHSPVRVWTLDGQEYPIVGRMNYFDTVVSAQTGTAMARAEFDNKADHLKPGQFVKAKIVGWDRPNTIVVPQRAIIQNPAGKFVMIVGEGDATQIRPVVLGEWIGSGWVVESGLKGGERVIVEGFAKAPPGTVVKPVPFVDHAASSVPAGTPAVKSEAKAEAKPEVKPESKPDSKAGSGEPAGKK